MMSSFFQCLEEKPTQKSNKQIIDDFFEKITIVMPKCFVSLRMTIGGEKPEDFSGLLLFWEFVVHG